MTTEQTQTPITVLTENAAVDDLTPDDYWNIYHWEMRQWDDTMPRRDGKGTGDYRLSLTDFCEQYSPDMSKAMWSKLHTAWNAGDREEVQRVLTRRTRNILRRGAGMPELPPSVSDVLQVVDANARVTQVGTDKAGQVIVVATDKPLQLYVSGTVRILEHTAPARSRPHKIQPVFTPELDERRTRIGKSWNEIAERGLRAFEEELAQNS